jgi:hypothetical protein
VVATYLPAKIIRVGKPERESERARERESEREVVRWGGEALEINETYIPVPLAAEVRV